MLKYTKHNLKKIESLFQEMGYTIRYEKGNFQSGYCMVENRKIAVINKFFDTEGRIGVLLEVFDTLPGEPPALSEAAAKLYKQIQSRTIDTAAAEEDTAEETAGEEAASTHSTDTNP